MFSMSVKILLLIGTIARGPHDLLPLATMFSVQANHDVTVVAGETNDIPQGISKFLKIIKGYNAD